MQLNRYDSSYVAVDTETTGLNPRWDKIIEVAMLKVEHGEVTDTFQTLINPRRKLEERIVELTGITDDMLSDKPDMKDVIADVVDFCGGLPLLGHHVIFDYSFLKRAAVNFNLEFERRGIDTLQLCRKFMPAEEKKNLQTACEYFGVERRQAHRALGDAMDAHELYRKLEMLFCESNPEAFVDKPLIYKIKREFPASKKQKEHLRDLLKYHRIDLTVQIDYLSRNEISRITDKIISQYGRLTMKQK